MDSQSDKPMQLGLSPLMQHIVFSRLVRCSFFAIELAQRESAIMVIHEAAGAKLCYQKSYRRALDVTAELTPGRLC
jgi:hypothetical protein